MQRVKYDWIIGIDPKHKRIEIVKNNPANPGQVSHLISVKCIHANKVSRQVIREYQFVLETLFK